MSVLDNHGEDNKMYTDIPEWSDTFKIWGTVFAFGLLGAGIVGGLLYLFHLI